MIRRSILACTLVATTLAPAVSHAFPFFSKGDTAQAKVKLVKMTLKNQTDAPMNILIEDKPVTIAAKGEYLLSAPEGTHIYGADKAIKVLVTRDLNGSTASFR